ncbi:MAG TPA: lamin tail domain-containing protein, partial [Anaerolineales bacterium]|nr:lamin tail domain-containing protein [Anaerolineales bacterium]
WPAGNSSNRATMERHSPKAQDSLTNWYTFVGPLPNGHQIVYDRNGNVILGTPGQSNWAATVTATPSPVPTRYKTPTARPPTPFPHMVVNEFLPRAGTDWNQDKRVDVFDEFIEVKNLGPINGSLQGWKIDNLSSEGNTSFVLPNVTLKPGDRAVFYGSTSRIALYDSGGTVRLTNNRGVIVDARSYGAVASPDQTTCRIPDGYYWRFPCFPTPGNENSLTGVVPIPPPVAEGPPPCLMADIVPAPFRDAECYGYGGDVYSSAYWDDQSGFNEYPVQDSLNKNLAVVK